MYDIIHSYMALYIVIGGLWHTDLVLYYLFSLKEVIESAKQINTSKNDKNNDEADDDEAGCQIQ